MNGSILTDKERFERQVHGSPRCLSVGLVREQMIDIIVLIVLAGFVLSACFHYFMGAYMHKGYPFNSFLFRPGDRFMDYFNGLTYVTEGHGEGMKGIFGSAYLLFRFVYLISFKNTYVSFVVYTATIVVYLLSYNLKNLLSGPFPRMAPVKLVRSLFVLSFLSYPLLFTLDRGNVEGFAFMLLSLFVYFFCSNRTGISSLFLAAAAALKVYPIVFIILYLAEKKYKEAAIFVGALLVLSAFAYDEAQGFSFHLLRLVEIIKGSADPAQLYNVVLVIGNEGAAFSSSAYGALKAAIYGWGPQDPAPLLMKLFSTYYSVSLLLFALIALYVIIVEKELWKKVAILTLSMMVFPFVTADYRLLNLYVPMWLFLNSEKRSGEDLLYSVLFGLLLIPKAYYFIRGDISISVILNPLIIFVFLLSMIAIGLRNASVTDITQSMREHLAAARNIFRLRKAVPQNNTGASNAKHPLF